MHHARAILTVLSLLAGTALTYRVWRASAFGIFEMATSLTTAALLAAAVGAGWAIHVRRVRAETAEWDNARQRRQDALLDGDEDKALWDSVPAADVDEDTCAFGVNVIAINQYRYPQAG